MQNKFGTPPSRPPLKPKHPTSWWLITLSVLQGLTLLFLVFIFVQSVGLSRQVNKLSEQPANLAPLVQVETPIPGGQEQTEQPAPPNHPEPSLIFEAPQQPFDFNQPVAIPYTAKNIDLEATIQFELFKADGSLFDSREAGLLNEENKLILPASKFVGAFTLKAILNGKELGLVPFVINPPAQPALDDVLEIRPHIKIGEQYILLPGISTIRLKDTAWQVDVGTLDANIASVEDGGVIRMNGEKPETEDVEPDFNRALPSFSIPVIMSGVFDSNGNAYMQQVSVPLLAQNSLPAETKGALLNYDVFSGKFPDDKTDQEVLDNIANFVTKNSIFSIREFESANPVKKYSVVMVVGKINKTTFDGMDEFKDISGTFQDSLVPFLFPEKEKIMEVNNQAVRTMDGQGSANIKNGISGANFYIIGKLDNSYQIVLFGVIGQ